VRRALIALTAAIATLLAAELGHRVRQSARGHAFTSEAARIEIRSAARRKTAAEPGAPNELAAILHPYFGSETPHDAGGVIRRFTAEPHSDALRIVVLGGSVAFIFVEDVKKLVTERLAAHPRLGGRRVELLDYAHHGYKQPQQVNKLAYLLARGARPDAVIEIDGFNEVALARGNWNARTDPLFPASSLWAIPVQSVSFTPADFERIGAAWEKREAARGLAEFSERFGLHHSSLASRWILGRIGALNATVAELEHTQALSTQVAPGSTRWRQIHGADLPADRHAAMELCVTAWEEGSVSLDALCRARGIPYLHVLQPTLWDRGSKPLTPHEQELSDQFNEWTGPVLHTYPKLRERGAHLRESGVNFVDASRVFAQVEEGLYYDYCHVDARGNELLWEFLQPHVLDLLAPPK
jgi:hypothetical protein